MSERQDQTGKHASSSCPSCVQLQHDLTQQAQALEEARQSQQVLADNYVKLDVALADARRELEDAREEIARLNKWRAEGV